MTWKLNRGLVFLFNVIEGTWKLNRGLVILWLWGGMCKINKGFLLLFIVVWGVLGYKGLDFLCKDMGYRR